MAKKIILLVLAMLLIIGSVFVIRGCSTSPDYAEIEPHLKRLIADAAEVDKVLFGVGLPTYERVYDPASSLKVHHTNEYISDGNGGETERLVYYYRTLDERTVYAYRDSYLKPYSYIYVSEGELSGEEAEKLKADFPAGDKKPPEGAEFYSSVYSKDGSFCYLVPYTEKDYDFYYSQSDPDDYDYVRDDSPCRTVSDIRALAETVYTKSYMASLESTLFEGVESGGYILKARFYEKTDDGAAQLMQSNDPSDIMFTERRVYLFETAELQKWGSDKKNVKVTIDSYLPSAPDKIMNITVEMELVNGKWFLKSSTF